MNNFKADITSNFIVHWLDEFRDALLQNGNFDFIIFSTAGELLEKNFHMDEVVEYESRSLINPTFDSLIEVNDGVVFEGYITLGNYSSINKSFHAKIYKKEGELLLILDSGEEGLKEENLKMHMLNTEISELHSSLQREKANLKISMMKLKESNIQLAKYNSEKDHFLSILAHDLRNPFNSIVGFSQYLKSSFRHLEDEKIDEELTIIYDVSKKTHSLLEDLLSWGNSQTGNIDFTPINVSVVNIMLTVHDLLSGQALSKNINIENKVCCTGDIFADDNMLKTVLRNLISNSIKFTPEDGNIVMCVEEDNENYLFSIEDDGVGIKKEDIPKLFNSHIMYTTYGTKNEKGTGLGLALCEEFVKYHKGKIWVESELNKGSKFCFTIPK